MCQAGSTDAPFDYAEPDYIENGPAGAYRKRVPYPEGPDYVETGPDGALRKDLDGGDGFEEPGLPYEGPGPAEYPGPGSVEYGPEDGDGPDMAAGPDGPEDPEAEWGPGFGGEDEPLEGPPGPDEGRAHEFRAGSLKFAFTAQIQTSWWKFPMLLEFPMTRLSLKKRRHHRVKCRSRMVMMVQPCQRPTAALHGLMMFNVE